MIKEQHLVDLIIYFYIKIYIIIMIRKLMGYEGGTMAKVIRISFKTAIAYCVCRIFHDFTT
jgi:hypothetical protein